MTTPIDIWIHTIPEIKDRQSLELVARIVDAQLTVVDAQAVQLRRAQELVQQRMGEIG